MRTESEPSGNFKLIQSVCRWKRVCFSCRWIRTWLSCSPVPGMLPRLLSVGGIRVYFIVLPVATLPAPWGAGLASSPTGAQTCRALACPGLQPGDLPAPPAAASRSCPGPAPARGGVLAPSSSRSCCLVTAPELAAAREGADCPLGREETCPSCPLLVTWPWAPVSSLADGLLGPDSLKDHF